MSFPSRVRESVLELSIDRAPLRSSDRAERTTRGRADVRPRQQRSRLKSALRPQTPAAPGVDPWKLGAEAVELLTDIRRAVPRTSRAADALDEGLELVRQLAYGPEV